MNSSFATLSHTRAGGKRTHSLRVANEDRTLIRRFSAEETGTGSPALLLAVADGVSRCANGGGVADWLIHQKLRTIPIFGATETDPGEQLHGRLRKLHLEFLSEFEDEPETRDSGCTLAAALLYGARAIALWSGDSPIHHLSQHGDNLEATTLSSPDADPHTGALTDCFSGVTPFFLRHRHFELGPGDIVIAATDGIRFSGTELASTLDDLGFNEDWLEKICQASFDLPMSDDLAISAARILP